jgi:hypothetical protein
MKKFLLSGLICVPIYLLAQNFSDTFFCGGLAAILCNYIIHSVEDLRA